MTVRGWILAAAIFVALGIAGESDRRDAAEANAQRAWSVAQWEAWAGR